jgi:YidC/Oxa1 family membrane protein insertase
MEKRTIIAVVLSSLILIGYYGFFYKPPAPPPSSAPPSGATEGQPPASVQANAGIPETQEVQGGVPQKEVPLVESKRATDLVEAKFTSEGGVPQNWFLLKFFRQADQKGGNTDLLKSSEQIPALGLLLFPGKSVLYPAYELVGGQGPALDYRAQLGALELNQHVAMGQEHYSLNLILRVRNQGEVSQQLSPGLRLTLPEPLVKPSGLFGFLSGGPPLEQVSPLYRVGTTVEREQDVKKLGVSQEQIGDISWAGLEDRYFLRAVLARAVSAQNSVSYGKKGDWVYTEFRYPPATLAAGEEREFPFTLYLGPKDPTYLNQFAALDLGQAIDYGWFGLVARPILQTLKFFYGFLGNWGLAIILLTIIIKLLLHPLTRKSMASMKGMQALQPQLKAIREKYKDDKERLNMETMNLFKRHKVNPMGGCLPMLLQMPIYIALYKVLYNATELYHAPFFWFYRDLAAPDPYFILPILLGIAMVAQQKMTPSTGDAAQQKMMMLMPILFTVFMLFLPVGLVLYIFVNTLMTVVQQYMHQKDITFLGLLKGKKASA